VKLIHADQDTLDTPQSFFRQFSEIRELGGSVWVGQVVGLMDNQFNTQTASQVRPWTQSLDVPLSKSGQAALKAGILAIQEGRFKRYTLADLGITEPEI